MLRKLWFLLYILSYKLSEIKYKVEVLDIEVES